MQLFSDQEFGERFAIALQAIADEGFDLHVHTENQDVGLPRSSSIFACARQQQHRLQHRSITDPRPPAEAWAPSMGAAGQELVALTLARMGYTVTPPQDMPHDVTSGHFDFELSGLDFGDEVLIGDAKIKSVVSGRFMFRDGPDVAYVGQLQDYLRKRGRKKAVLIVCPHDISAYTNEVVRYKVGQVAPLVQRYFIEADARLQQLVVDRAAAIITANELNLIVGREYNPAKDNFPCGWCATRTHCERDEDEVRKDPDKAYIVPPVPPMYTND